jgi:hypothetical protein
MTESDIIALGAAIVAFVALGVSVVVALRQERLAKQQLKLQRDSDLLESGSRAVDALQAMLEFAATREHFVEGSERRIEGERLCSSVSAEIDKGRWFLPNIEDQAGKFGIKKELAYRGFRQIALDALVYSHDRFSKWLETDHLDQLKREELIKFLTDSKRVLVSEVQHTVDPRRIQKLVGDRPNYPEFLKASNSRGTN